MRRPPRFVPAQGLVPLERVERTILILRGRRVILDSELAALYGASAKRLNEQVKRNAERFPADFAFKLTPEEFGTLRSQFGPQNLSSGDNRWAGWAAASLSLAAPRAIQSLSLS